ncbi:MAG: rhodanese-like domain-containing protein [Mycobacterium sp.]
MKNTRLSALTLLAAVVVSGGVVGCSSASSSAERGSVAAGEVGSPGRVGVAEFTTLLTRPGIQIVDVRTPAEFADGHIAGAVNIPVQQPDFIERIARLDPKATYAVYCHSGNRSKSAVAQMQGAGIANIFELASGTSGWTAEGHSLVQ